MTARRFVVVFSLVATIMLGAHAEFAEPNYLPADRIIANIEAHLKDQPNDARAHYTLGRVHYICFMNAANFVATYERQRGDTSYPHVTGDFMQRNVAQGARRSRARAEVLKIWGFASESDIPSEKHGDFWSAVRDEEDRLTAEGFPESISEADLIKHADAAASSLKKALDLDPNNAGYMLTLASFYKQYLDYMKKSKPDPVPLSLKPITLAKTRALFLAAYEAARDKDRKLDYKGMALETGNIISYEAGKAYIGMSPVTDDQSWGEWWKLREIQKHIKRIENLPQGPITPIIFTLESHEDIDELLAPDRSVRFDLDGDGTCEAWPWVKRSTAFLVWDPAGTGTITSGRQLFGSATWWLLFSDGYRAMNVLDNDRDGRLAGDELRGIAAWFDRNCDGQSQPGEVVPVADLGMVSIDVRATGKSRGMLMNSRGIASEDGQNIPTYDWVTRPSVVGG